MSFSQITSVDLVVNQITTIVTKYSPSSPAGVNTTGDIVPLETVIKIGSNVGLSTMNGYVSSVQTYIASNIGNMSGIAGTTINYDVVNNATALGITSPRNTGQTFNYDTKIIDAASANLNSALTDNTIAGRAYTAAAGGANGSAVFNGTTQYLTANTAATWTFLHNGLQDYTIECWFNTNSTAYQNLMGTGGATSQIGFELSIGGSAPPSYPGQGGVWIVYERGVSLNNTAAFAPVGSFTIGTWNHVAATFVSSTKTATIYVNGTLAVATANAAFAYSASAPTNTLGIGFTPSTNYFNGYITNVRIVKAIVYSANFTPALPLTSIANTQLLLSFNSSAALLTDSSPNNSTITNNAVVAYSANAPSTSVAVTSVNSYYNTQYFGGGLNIPYGDITANISGYTAQTYTAPGTYTWTVPAGVTSITLGAIGGGGGGVQKTAGGNGGNGANVAYSNSYTVTPGQSYTIVVGAGGSPGAVFGNTGGSTYMTLSTSNVAVVVAGGGAGGSSLYWLTDEISVTTLDASGIIARVTAADPSARTITYSISSGSLPTGGSLNTANGAITWTKQNLSSITEYAPFTVSAAVAAPVQTITKRYTIKITI
jgi:hypothetical protein